MLRNIDLKKTADAIQNWILKQVTESNTNGVVIGLSGGIDSSLTASLCVNALGSSKVHGILMPCNSVDTSIQFAEEMVKKLGIESTTVQLDSIYDGFEYALPNMSKLARGNLKSRLRMCTLYAQANTMNRLVCGTTNLTEMILGYFTKYGDGGIDIEPIAALLKSEVRDMARVLGVPEHIVVQTPTADLWQAQTDESELGCSYYELDKAVLKVLNQPEPNGEVTGKAEEVVRRWHEGSFHKRAVPPSMNTVIEG